MTIIFTVIGHLIRISAVFCVFVLATDGINYVYGKWFLFLVCMIVVTVVSETLGRMGSK